MDLYDPHNKVKNGYVYYEIVLSQTVSGIYGLRQEEILMNKLLKERLQAVHGYYKVAHTPGLFTHKTRLIWFTLTVDNFGVKYIGREQAEHLILVVKQHYKMKKVGKGNCTVGQPSNETMKKDKYVDISMPNYTHKKLVE